MNNLESVGAYKKESTSEEKHEWAEIGPNLNCPGNMWTVKNNPDLKMGNPNIEVKLDDPFGAKSSMAKDKKPF